MKALPLDPGFWTKTSWIQLGYGVWVNLTQVGIGFAFGFQAVTVANLFANDDLVSIDEESWIATVLTLSAPLGCLISGSVLDRCGRKAMIIVSQVPMFVGWFCTGFSTATNGVIIGRIITGVGCGMTIVPSRIYSTEISLPNMRGVIGIFPDIAIAIGITIQTRLNSALLWKTSCYIYGFYAMALIVCNFFLPETPYYELLKGNFEKAQNALTKFRGRSYDKDDELDDIADFQRDNDIRRLNVKDKIVAVFKKSTLIPFGITSIYFTFAELSGVNIIMLWTIEVLESSNSSMDPYKGTLILAFTRLIIAVFTSMLLFKVGKKPMALISAFGVGAICLGLGIYLSLDDVPTIVPQICYIVYIAFATMGYYTLPYLIMTEVYPLQVRGFMAGITMMFVSFLIFATYKCYPYIRNFLGIANTVLFYGVSSLIGTMIIYFYLPETTTLTLQEIEEYYNDRRPTLISQRRIRSMLFLEHSSKSITNKTKQNVSKFKTNIGSSYSLKTLKARRHKAKKATSDTSADKEGASKGKKLVALAPGNDDESETESKQ